MIGRTLDRYRIESKLGEGGMGVVYKARDTHLDRVVAIKVLPPEAVADPERKERFVQEARAASALNHPGIVTLHDIRSDAGVDFIVMEYIAGRTLDALVPPQGLPASRALRYAVGIADAVAKAHEAGILHRDLKPSNIMVTDDERVKVLDFGLAKLLDSHEAAEETRTRAATLTAVGTIVGTSAYMSPEQAEGRSLDARSDVFSFGVVLYEMVTGRRPFAGDSPRSTLTKLLTEEPVPPGQLVASLPPDIERTILRCLRKDPDRRYQTMADLRVTLQDLLADVTSGTALGPAAASARRPRRIWAAVVLVPLIAAGAYVGVRARRASGNSTPLVAVPLTSLPGVKRSPSFSPDGNQVAYSWSNPQSGNTDIYVQQVGAGSPLRLTTDPAVDYSPMWSPDGRWIAFFRARTGTLQELTLIPPLGGPERKLSDVPTDRSVLRELALAWSADSSYVVVTQMQATSKPDALFGISVESGEKTQLTFPPPQVFQDRDPSVSPDGRWLLFRRDQNPLTGELYRVPLAPLGAKMTTIGEPVRLTGIVGYNSPQWTADSTEVLFNFKGGLWRLNAFGKAAPTLLPFVGADGLMPMVSKSRPGERSRLVYARSYSDTNIWRVETTAAGEAAIAAPALAISSTRWDAQPNLSPDGRRVVFSSTRSGENEIWIADVDGGNAVQLTSQGANPGFARWSPDGRLIAYHSDAEAPAGDIFVVPSAGGKPRKLTDDPGPDTFPSFSRDGRWIYFASAPSGTPAIWKIPTGGGAPTPVTKEPSLFALESADGNELYYVAKVSMNQSGPLMRMPLKGGTPTKVADGVDTLRFDVLEHGVYYVELADGDAALRYFDFTSRRSSVVIPKLANLGYGLTASRDGRVLFFARVDSTVDDLMLVENFH